MELEPCPLPTALGPHRLGMLCVGGDWACAHGDLAALRDIAQQLTVTAEASLHCELEALADACLARPARACDLWWQLRDRLYPAMPA